MCCRDLAADLAQITFDFPFKIPPYFALIIRAISVLEGIALLGNPGQHRTLTLITHALTLSPTHSPPTHHSLTHSLTQSPTHSLTHSPTHHSLTHSLTHPLTHLLTYSLGPPCTSLTDVATQPLLCSAKALILLLAYVALGGLELHGPAVYEPGLHCVVSLGLT